MISMSIQLLTILPANKQV